MGKRTITSPDTAGAKGEGTLTGVGNGDGVLLSQGDFNLNLSGTWTGSIKPERSFDGGATWLAFTYVDGSAVTWTNNLSTILAEPEDCVLWRVTAQADFTGSVTWRISQ